MLTTKITETGPTPKLLRREANEIHRQTALEMGDHWFHNFRAKHFTTAGASEYGYTPRQGERGNAGLKGFRRSYTGRKLRLKGHTRPLVYSGQSENLTKIKDVRATATKEEAKGRVVIHAPTFNRKGKGSRCDMRAEIQTISAPETVILAQVAGSGIARRYKAIRDSQTTTH